MHCLRLMRLNFQIGDNTVLYRHTVGKQLPFQVISTQITEEVFVINGDFTLFEVLRSYPDILVDVAYLIHMRIQAAVRIDQTVIEEVLSRSIVFIEVASITEILYALFCKHTGRLVDEVPDKATLIFRFFPDQVPILLEAAFGITHCMRILTLDKRFAVITAQVFQATVKRDIHRAIDIGKLILLRLFVLYGT